MLKVLTYNHYYYNVHAPKQETAEVRTLYSHSHPEEMMLSLYARVIKLFTRTDKVADKIADLSKALVYIAHIQDAMTEAVKAAVANNTNVALVKQPPYVNHGIRIEFMPHLHNLAILNLTVVAAGDRPSVLLVEMIRQALLGDHFHFEGEVARDLPGGFTVDITGARREYVYQYLHERTGQH